MALDIYIPKYEFRVFHSISIDADPARVYTALKELLPREISWMVRFLLAVRDLPYRLFRKVPKENPDEPFLSQMIAQGATLLEDSQDGVVFGMIGEFWKLTGGEEIKPADRREFVEFDAANYATAVADMRIAGENGKTVLSTETRVSLPNEKNRRKFAFYWRLIYLPGNWIRRLWLRAVKRKAEKLSMT
jgi:hypothetical protein